jgi:hypothetical protein
MPRFMLKKVAIGQAFRLAFPEELGGMPYMEIEDVTPICDVCGNVRPPNVAEYSMSTFGQYLCTTH